jgi:tetratricopeptide (TPR) repeat protein
LSEPTRKYDGLLPASLIAVATAAAYWPSLGGDFIWNDSDYVTAPGLRSVEGLSRIWTDLGATQQYYPLLHSAFWVQHRLWGDHPIGYHIVTIVLHAACAIGFAAVLGKLLGGDRRFAGAGWLAALVFALHPVHVESVAWITEQKNTLSLAFYLGSVLAYLRFDAKRTMGAYFAALALFVLSMECKTVTATLPAALLVIFWWKRGRIDLKRDALPLVPWLVLGGAWGVFSSWVEQTYVGAQGATFAIPLADRILVAGRSIWFYLGKLVWPFGLNFIYPRWRVDPGQAWQWLYPLAALGLGIGLWLLRNRTRAPLAAYLFFAGSLFPVLGFVNLYGARYSWVWDHWQYLPDLGPIALASGAVALLWNRRPRPSRLGLLLAAVLAIPLGALSWAHELMFHDDQTLYLDTLRRNPDCWLAYNNLGNLWVKIPGRVDDAIRQYEQVLRLNPDYAEAHNNLGLAWTQLPGKLDDAIAQFEEAIRLEPDYAQAHSNLGVALAREGRSAEALVQYEEAVRLEPEIAEPHYNLATALAASPGRIEDAIAQYKEVIRLKPDDVKAHNDLAGIYLRMPGRLDDAIEQYGEAVQLEPGNPELHDNLALALEQSPGRLDDAISECRTALRLDPNSVNGHLNLANALSQFPGRLDDALAEYRETIRLRPNFPAGWYNLGVCCLRLGNPSEAAAAFREVLRLSPGNAAAERALSIALRGSGGPN